MAASSSSLMHALTLARRGSAPQFAFRSGSTVSAIQKGRVIFIMYASFQRAGEGFEHQESMPNVPMPDQILSTEEIRKRYYSDPRIPLKKREKLAGRKSIKVNPLEVQVYKS